MNDKQRLLAQLDYFNMVHGVTLQAIGTLSNEELDFRPRPGMRSPRELIFHIYTQEKILAEAARQGRFDMEAANRASPESDAGVPGLKALATVNDARKYAAECHQITEDTFRVMSEEDLARPVESPFGPFPASQYLAFAYDEHWHHRGQLYTYLRLLGKEPPNLYNYGS